jgi:hypothetical protein
VDTDIGEAGTNASRRSRQPRVCLIVVQADAVDARDNQRSRSQGSKIGGHISSHSMLDSEINDNQLK